MVENMYTVILRAGDKHDDGTPCPVVVCMITQEELIRRFNTHDQWRYNTLEVLGEYTFGGFPNEFPPSSILILKNGEVIIPKPVEVHITKFDIK